MTCPTYTALFDDWIEHNEFSDVTSVQYLVLRKHFDSCRECITDARDSLSGAKPYVDWARRYYNQKLEAINGATKS